MVWLSALLPYEQCQAVFERLTHRPMPTSSIWRQTQRYGEQLQQAREQQQEQVQMERVVLPDALLDHSEQKAISLDGGMVNIREEGWKEFKVGTVFEVDLHLAQDSATQDWSEIAHGVNINYVSVLGSVDQFAPALWALAVEQQVPTARKTSVTADGAAWIWNLAADYFPLSMQILDWYHALSHLASAAQALYTDERAWRRWFDQRKNDLFRGRIDTIIQPLENADLHSHATYFQTHQRRMQYLEFREQGYPIGSGAIESGVKQFKARLTGPGMRWKRSNAQRMLDLRAAVLGDNFDQLWLNAA